MQKWNLARQWLELFWLLLEFWELIQFFSKDYRLCCSDFPIVYNSKNIWMAGFSSTWTRFFSMSVTAITHWFGISEAWILKFSTSVLNNSTLVDWHSTLYPVFRGVHVFFLGSEPRCWIQPILLLSTCWREQKAFWKRCLPPWVATWFSIYSCSHKMLAMLNTCCYQFPNTVSDYNFCILSAVA